MRPGSTEQVRHASTPGTHFMQKIWSGRPDLNRRPPVPQTGALPDCATPRRTGSLSPGRQAPCGRVHPAAVWHPAAVKGPAAVRFTAAALGRPNGSCQRSISCPLDGPTSAAGATRGIGPVCTARCHARHGSSGALDRWNGSARWRQEWPKEHLMDAWQSAGPDSSARGQIRPRRR